MFLLFLFIFLALILEQYIFHLRVKGHTRLMAYAVLFVFLLLVYFRPFYFRDTESYFRSFNRVQWTYLSNVNLLNREPNTGMEYGFVLIELIFKSLGFSFRLFSVSISLFFVFCTYKFVNSFIRYVSDNEEDQSDKMLIFLLFLPHFGLFYNFIAIREALAFSFLFIGSIRAMKKDWLGAFFLAFFAFSVQRLSVVGVVPITLILAPRPRLSKKSFLTIWMIIGGILFFEGCTHFFFLSIGLPIMNFYNNHIMNSAHRELFDMKNRIGLSKLMIMLSQWLSGFPLLMRYKDNSKKIGSFFAIYLFSLLGSIMLSGNEGSYRITDYMYIYCIPLAYYGLKAGEYPIRIKKAFVFLLTISFSLYWGVQFIGWMFHG